MLKETEKQGFFVLFLSLVAFRLEGGARAPWAHLATPMMGGQTKRGSFDLQNLLCCLNEMVL